MQVIHFYLVSIFLSYIKLSSNQPNTALSTISTISSLSTRSNQNDGFSTKRYTKLSPNNALPYNAFRQAVQKKDTMIFTRNGTNNFINSYKKDQLTVVNPVESDIINSSKQYNSKVIRFLNFVLQACEATKDGLENTRQCFNILKNIVTIVDVLNRQINPPYEQYIKIDHLLNSIYSMFNIPQMSNTDPNNTDVINNLMILKSAIESAITEVQHITAGVDIVENLNNILLHILDSNKYDLSFIIIDILLTRVIMLINKPVNKALNIKEKELPTDYLNGINLQQYEINESAIDENHVKLFSTMMPNLFVLLYNHIKLLTMVRKYRIDKNYEIIILQNWNKLFGELMNIFNNYYLLYVGEENTSELNAINQLLNMLKDLKSTQELNYYNNEQLLELTENAITNVLVKIVETNYITEWKESTIFKMDYKEDKGEDYYKNLLAKNTNLVYWSLYLFENNLFYKNLNNTLSYNHIINGTTGL